MAGREKLGVWGQQIQTAIYNTDKQQGCPIHKYISIFLLLGCTPETNTL